MGKTFYDLSCEELCDLMCGGSSQEKEDDWKIKELNSWDGVQAVEEILDLEGAV